MKNIHLLLLISALITSSCVYSAELKKKPAGDTVTCREIEKSVVLISGNLYAGKFEVSNKLYRIFLTNLMKIGADEKYSIAQIDSLNWRETRCGFAELFLEPYVELYFRHPAYSEHPVVNVSFQGAQLFCEWLTGYYNSMPGRKYKKVRFRLPTDTEWEHAAKGGLEYVLYPWGNRLIYNNQYACNYYHVGDENIIRNISTGTLIVNERKADASPGKLNDFNSLTVPVTYYQPNEFGLYNVCGNVAEMVIDKPVARGGGWLSPGGDVTIFSSAVCTQSAIDTGFRYFMEVVEY